MSDNQTEGGVDIELVSAIAEELIQKLDGLVQFETKFPATVSVAAPELDAWQWLNANQSQTRVVWSCRDGSEIVAGVGAAANVELNANGSASECIASCRELIGGNTELKFFGGFSFDGSDSWQSFGAGRFVIPRLLLSRG